MMDWGEKNPPPAGTIWMLNLDEPVPMIQPRVPATFRRAEPDLIPTLVETLGRDASVELRRRFDTGRRCYTAWVGDQLGAYGWVSFVEEHVGEVDLRIQLLHGEAYIWDCATMRSFRRNLLYSALLGHIVRELCTEGFCRAWIGADMENGPSQQGMARAGFHHIADLFVAAGVTTQKKWVEGLPGVEDFLVTEARRVFLNRIDGSRKNGVSSGSESLNS